MQCRRAAHVREFHDDAPTGDDEIGDSGTTGSMGYQWQNDGQIQWHNDVTAGYASQYYMCDVADKLP